MERKFKRGYIEYEFVTKSYMIRITKVIQSDEFGKWEDIDEEEKRAFVGYDTIEEAKKDLEKYNCKEIIVED